MLKNIVVLCITIVSAKAERPYDESWPGRYFPQDPHKPSDPNPVVSDHMHDSHHGVRMGVADASCDNAKVNLKVDWYDNPENYTCFEDKSLYLPNETVHPIYTEDHIPHGYSAPHKCMNHTLVYDHDIPTFGPHRPLWAKYGDYTFVPKQRWLHNLEHGAVVALYHPCADPNEIYKMKCIVKSCLFRHIITPYNLLTCKWPFVLVTWGHRLHMSKVDSAVMQQFMVEHALHGPESASKDGQYGWMLEEHAQVPEGSDRYDHNVCPSFQDSDIEME